MVRLILAAAALFSWASLTTATSSESFSDDFDWTTVDSSEWTPVASARPSQTPFTDPIEGQLTSHGCYGALPRTASYQRGVSFVASGSCYEACKNKNMPVMILHATQCYCASIYPPEDSIVDDEKCDYGCPGYNREACGGLGTGDGESTYSVFNTGLELDVNDDKSDGSSAKSTNTHASAKATATATGSKSSSSNSGSSSHPLPSDSSSASEATGTPTRASSTPSPSTVGESSGIVQQSSLMHISAWLLFIFAI